MYSNVTSYIKHKSQDTSQVHQNVTPDSKSTKVRIQMNKNVEPISNIIFNPQCQGYVYVTHFMKEKCTYFIKSFYYKKENKCDLLFSFKLSTWWGGVKMKIFKSSSDITPPGITPPPCSKTSTAPGGGHYSWVQDVHISVMMWVRAVVVLDLCCYKPLSYSSPCAINSRIHCSCFTRE